MVNNRIIFIYKQLSFLSSLICFDCVHIHFTVSPEMHKKPTDVIVIDGDEQKKIVEGYPRLETAEGNQASSMLRRLASAGNGKLEKMKNRKW